MANEARVQSGVQIRDTQTGFYYPLGDVAFSLDVSNPRGPTPGLLNVSTTVQAVDLSQLTLPGLCKITNLDQTVTLEVGLKIGSAFYPFMDVQPTKHYVFYLARYFGYDEHLPGTGTGTVDAGGDSQLAVRMRGPAGAYSSVLVEAFEA